MAGSAVRDLEATGATEQWARLFGFLVALGAAIFLMGWISLAMFYALTIGAGERLEIVWIALFGSTPIATVVVYAVGWRRQWSVTRSIAASLAGAVAVFTTTILVVERIGDSGFF